MIRTLSLGLSALAMFASSQPRLTARPLADIGTISVPRNLSAEGKGGYWNDEMGRLTFGFSSTYLWASMSGIMRYRQQLIVSVMAPDATEAEYAAPPRRMSVTYEQRKRVRTSALGTGTLTVTEGIYARGVETEPAYHYLYTDRAHRLQLAWHAVKKEVDLEAGVAQIARIAESFRITRDPVATFAAMRDAPRKEGELRAGKLATVQAMLKREGYVALEPGTPVLRNGVYLEWMSEPEPRYQLLVPLGRVRAPANGSVVNRPRPVRGAVTESLAGTIGWRAIDDGEWVFSNAVQAYLPMKGIGARLAAQQQDPAFVYFYYVGTVRVEEESDDRRLASLRWFLDGVPDVQRQWREGALVAPGKPERD
jgi:hypothetical protein